MYKKTLCKGLRLFMFYICITSLSFNWYQESKRLHPMFYLYTAQLLTPEIRTVNSTTNIPLQARWWQYTPLIPALQGEGAASGQRQADICDFEAPLVYKGSSRTGSKATDKLSLGWGIPIQIVHKSLTFPKCVKIYTISYQKTALYRVIIKFVIKQVNIFFNCGYHLVPNLRIHH